MKTEFILLLALTFSHIASAQTKTDLKTDKAAVKNVIERFLTVIGNYELESLPPLFCENANIGGASFRNGEWNTFTMSFTEFLEQLKSRENPIKYSEPVSKYTIHINGGMLAFVKADAVLIRNGKAQSNNFDYFTLLKENGEWKILNGSYVSIPINEK
jgi:hypothetical protein